VGVLLKNPSAKEPQSPCLRAHKVRISLRTVLRLGTKTVGKRSVKTKFIFVFIFSLGNKIENGNSENENDISNQKHRKQKFGTKITPVTIGI
jgi:hypothetical protein